MNSNDRITSIKVEELKLQYHNKHGEPMMNICDINNASGEQNLTIYRGDYKTLEDFLDRVSEQRAKLNNAIFFCDGEFYAAKFEVMDANTFEGKKHINACSDAYKFIWTYRMIK